MAFIVEDGTGKSDANAYITTEFFKSYNKDRGRVVTDSTTTIQQAIVVASDYLDTKFVFIGVRQLSTQSMEWPRVNAFYQDGRTADNVPVEVQECTAELALRQLSAEIAPDPTYDPSNRLIESQRNQVGPIVQDTKFTDGGAPILFRSYPFAEERLKELIVNGQFLQRI